MSQVLELRSCATSALCGRANNGTKDGVPMSTPVEVRHDDRGLLNDRLPVFVESLLVLQS